MPNAASPLPVLKFDFHLHTIDDPYDQHVYHTVFELLDKAAGLGYGALAITLHNKQFKSQAAEDYARERGILLLPGVERNVEGCHVLMINFPAGVIESVFDFEDLRRARAGHPRGLIIAAHPYFPGAVALKDNLLRHKDLFDAVEVSGFYHRRWNPNRKAVAAARRLGLPLVGNSDTHTLEQFGTTWSEAECGQDADAIVAAVKSGRVKVRGRALRLVEMGVIGWKVIARGYMRWIDYKRERAYESVE